MLIIGCFFSGKWSTVIGHFYEGEVGVVLETGEGCLGVLTAAIQEAPLSDRLQLYTNYTNLVQVYQKPLRLALPDVRTERYSFVDKTGQTQWRARKVPYGNDAQWALLRALNRYWSWSIDYIDDLPLCREWGELNYG